MEGVGPSKADIMIIGDCPGYSDDYAGEPFTGDSGAKLNYLLEKAKIDRDDVYLTFAVKCKAFRPSDIKAKHIDACEPYLMREILDVRPKVIITMGKSPLISLTGETTVKDFRGHFETFEIDYTHKKKERTFKTQVMPTFSAVASLAKWEYDDYIIHDLKKAKKFLKTKEVPMLPVPEYKLVLSVKALKEFVERYSNCKSFNTDFETTGLKFFKHEIINSGYADDTNFATIIPFTEYKAEHMEHKKWTEEDVKLAKKINKFIRKHKKRIKRAMKQVHASKAKKILHNGKFDAKFARYNGIPYKNFYFDTILADALIDENKYHDLNSCMEYRGINYGPYDTKLWPYVNKSHSNKKSYQFIPPTMICEYLAIDVCGDRRLYLKQKKELKKEDMEDNLLKTQMPLSHLMARCEYTGTKFNSIRLKEVARIFEARIMELEEKVRKITKDKELNLGSPKQLLAFFESKNYPFEKMQIKKGKTGYSCGEATLKKFAMKKKWAKIPKLILEHRSLVKMKGTFLDGKDGTGGLLQFIDAKSRIHSNWNLHTPRTGRMSCSDPNLQQIPRPNADFPDANVRQLFEPTKKGWVMFEADYAQLELRVGAHLSQDKTMIKEVQQGVDLHTRNAVRFGTILGFLSKDMTEERFLEIKNYKPPKKWKKKYKTNKKKYKQIENLIHEAGVFSEHRSFAKTLGFGLNYGMDANTLASQFSMDVEDVQDAIDLYFEKYHLLNDWREEIKELSIEEGVLILPETGRKRRFTGASKWFNHENSHDCRKRDFDIGAIHRQAMNFPIQGFANEIYVAGKLKLDRELRKRKMKTRILISVHDGLIGEGPKSEMPMVQKLAKESMERMLGKGKLAVPMEVDFEMFDKWYGTKYEMKDLGLKELKRIVLKVAA